MKEGGGGGGGGSPPAHVRLIKLAVSFKDARGERILLSGGSVGSRIRIGPTRAVPRKGIGIRKGGGNPARREARKRRHRRRRRESVRTRGGYDGLIRADFWASRFLPEESPKTATGPRRILRS